MRRRVRPWKTTRPAMRRRRVAAPPRRVAAPPVAAPRAPQQETAGHAAAVSGSSTAAPQYPWHGPQQAPAPWQPRGKQSRLSALKHRQHGELNRRRKAGASRGELRDLEQRHIEEQDAAKKRWADEDAQKDTSKC